MRESLERLFELTGGALALVSGRPLADLDRLFAPLQLPAVGGHGAEMRVRDDEVFYWTKPLPQDLRRQLAAAQDTARALSSRTKVIRWRCITARRRSRPSVCAARRGRPRGRFPAEPTEVLPGKAMFEVKRPGVNKGESVRELMAHPPFAGRMPVFIGDDVTDESVFEVLPEIGGKGFCVES